MSLLLPCDEDDDAMDDGDDVYIARPRMVDEDEDSSKHQLACWILREMRFVGGVDDMSARLPWAATRGRLAAAFADPAVGDEVARWCTYKLEALSAAPDCVVDLLDEMQSWLRPPKEEGDEELEREHYLEPASLFGVFVRRTLLAATYTHFDGVAKTYDRICEYVRRYQENDYDAGFYASLLTRRELDVFLERRILAAASVAGSITLEETEAECSKIEALQPDLPRSSYLRFVASVHHREYLGALDNLHRYFDYAGCRGGPVSPNDAKGARGIVQYAALNLAAVHARFGHARLAAAALDECVRVSQQRHDHACVTFALGWLRYIDMKEAEFEQETYGPPLPGEDTGAVDALALQRCAKRAKQLNLRELESAALLCFARDALDYARTDEHYPDDVLTRKYTPSQASRASLAAWKLVEDAAKFESPGPRDGPDTSKLAQTPQQRLMKERKEREAGREDPQGLPKDCEITERNTHATDPQHGSVFRARCRRHAVQAAICGHNGFKRLQALEGRALLRAELRHLQRQRQIRGDDTHDGSNDLPEDLAPLVPRELACVDIAFDGLFGDFDAGDTTYLFGETFSTPKPDPMPEEGSLAADPDNSLRRKSDALTAKVLGPDFEDVEVPLRDEQDPIGQSGVIVCYDVALKKLKANASKNRGASNIVVRAEFLLKFEWAIHRHALRRAAALHEAVLGLSPRHSDLDVEAHIEALRCDLRLSIARDDYERAVKGASKLERICGNRGLWSLQAKLLIDRSKWLMDGCPQEPVPAMNPALRALALCERHALDALHAEATLRLALVQLGLGSIPKARDLFRMCHAKILELSHVDVQGDLWYALAQCDLEEKAYALRHIKEGRPEVFPDVDTTSMTRFNQVIHYYRRALECFGYTQNRKRMQDCHYFLARTYHQLDSDPIMMAKRDHHAKRALELQADMNRAVTDFEDLPELWILDED